eukprot:CAMPEP_0119546710 /NCGR_PEP_ID=MMETSP1352-20130426/1007_1 /TAXON_ID=265584 /ORGANISM="Stauroneis constricta, Strain CCMP1120" /LENGTH=731 /DNA_ID=CAMNT_0007591435 /DNA_START=50 /DNA_END=2245 /DNA_ORIENTATION=-
MPFLSKVGAMPQPKSKKPSKQRSNQSSSGRTSRSQAKGITIEDLKKQTARRLAHEHNQSPGPSSFGSVVRSTFGGNSASDKSRSHAQQQQSQNKKSQPSASSRSHAQGEAAGYSARQAGQQQQQHQHRHGYQSNASRAANHPNAHRNNGAQWTSKQQQKGGHHHPSASRNVHVNGGNVPAFSPNQPGGRYGGNNNQSHAQYSANQTQAMPNAAALDRNGKPKLPHGLTVQELKQMTKARLQAEAAERSDASVGSFEQQGRQFSPIVLDQSAPGVRREDFGASDVHNLQQLQPSLSASRSFAESYPDVPSSVQLSPNARQQPSPIPQSFHTSAPSNGFAKPNFVERSNEAHLTWSQPQSKSDAWDNASVTSNISEYSGYVSQNGGGLDDMGSATFVRARSNTAPGPGGLPMEYKGRSFNSSPSTPGAGVGVGMGFDAAIGSNRRRAQTMSPGGSTNVKRTQAMFVNASHGFDSFSAPGVAPLSAQRMTSPSTQMVPSVFRQAPVDNMSASGNVGIWGEIGAGGQERISSMQSAAPTTSTPEAYAGDALGRTAQVLHDSDMAAAMRYHDHQHHPSHRYEPQQQYQQQHQHQQLPSSPFGSFPRESANDGSPMLGESSSVFRDVTPFDQEREGPNRLGASSGSGISLNNSSNQFGNQIFSRVSSMESVSETVATSMWGDVSKSHASSLQSPDLDASIANSLGSILKLSGAAEKFDGDESRAQPGAPFRSPNSLF